MFSAAIIRTGIWTSLRRGRRSGIASAEPSNAITTAGSVEAIWSMYHRVYAGSTISGSILLEMVSSTQARMPSRSISSAAITLLWGLAKLVGDVQVVRRQSSKRS